MLRVPEFYLQPETEKPAYARPLQLLVGCVFALQLAACTQPEKTAEQDLQVPKTDTPAPKPVPRQHCYEWTEKNSRAVANLTILGDSVTGTLDYLFAEKDNSRGTLAGVMRGDTVFADYTFQSEGTTSVMQVIFLQQGDKLIQGHGDMRQEGAKMVYTAPKHLAFVTAFKGKPCK